MSYGHSPIKIKTEKSNPPSDCRFYPLNYLPLTKESWKKCGMFHCQGKTSEF